MTWKPAKVEIAYGSTPFSDPGTATWTDITTSVPGFTGAQGRSEAFDDMVAGECRFPIHNDAGALTPNRDKGTNLVPWDFDFAKGTREPDVAIATTADAQSWFAVVIGGAIALSATRGFVTSLTTAAVNNEIATNPFGTLGAIPVTPNAVYSANVQAASSVATQQGQGFISWRDANMVEISRSTSGAAVNLSTSAAAPTNLTIANVAAPATAYFAVLGVRQTTAVASTLSLGYPHLQTGASFTGVETMSDKRKPLIGTLVRVQVQDNSSVLQPLFVGAIESAEIENVDGSSDISQINIVAIDALKYLAKVNLPDAILAQNRGTTGMYAIAPFQDSGAGSATGLTIYNETLVSSVWTPLLNNTIYPKQGTGPSTYSFGIDGPTTGVLGVRCASTSTTDKAAVVSRLPVTPTAAVSDGNTLQGWLRIPQASTVKQFGMSLLPKPGSAFFPFGVYLGFAPTTGNVTVYDVFDESTVVNTGVSATDGAWHHLAISMNVTGALTAATVVYMDGVQIASFTYTALSSWDTVVRSASGYLYARPTGKTIDAAYFGIANTVLSAAQVKALYRAGSTGLFSAGVTADVAIGAALTFVNWPNTATTRSITASDVVVGGIEGRTSALDAMKQCSDGAGGMIYVDASGRVCFRPHDARFVPTVGLAVSEALGSTPEQDLAWTLDDLLAYSTCIVNGVQDGRVEVKISSSFGDRSFTVETALGDPTAMSSLANWLLYLRSKNQVRVGQISWSLSTSSAATWDALLTWGLGTAKVLDVSAMLRTQEPNLVTRFFIESFSWAYDQESAVFRVVCDLTPSTLYETGLITIDSNTQGQLDVFRLGL